MDEAQRVFNQTSFERKRTGRGASARKNGVKSKKCTLPSDHLTAAEKRKLSGECKMYDLSKPMKWDMFKLMPGDLQTEYIRKLASMGAGRADVCDMFGVRTVTYSEYMNKHHKGEKYFNRSTTGAGKNDDFVTWFVESGDIKTAKTEPKEPAANSEKNATEDTVEYLDSRTAPPVLQSGSVTFDGLPEAIWSQISNLLDLGERYQITVSFSLLSTL